jgi:pimeloyl-ACP methyl ester carboxylesterase
MTKSTFDSSTWDGGSRSPIPTLLVAAACMLLLNSCGLLGLLKPPPDDTKGVQDWLVIPVFYATNRSFDPQAGQLDYTESPNGKGLLFGVKNVLVPVPDNVQFDKATAEKMQWRTVHLDAPNGKGTPKFDRDQSPLRDQAMSRDEVLKAYKAYMDKTGSKESLVFVHGCCCTFDTTLGRAARVESHMQMPVLVYDWVSPQGFTNYLVNETRAEQTVDHFCGFLSKLEAIESPERVTVLGHSMGALLVDQAMVRRATQLPFRKDLHPYKELILCNPDVDAQTFLIHAAKFADNGSLTRIYMNRTDNRLSSSAIAHGGFPRLGRPESFLDGLTKFKNDELVDVTDLGTGHEIPYWLLANLHKQGNLGANKEFQLKRSSPGYVEVVKTTVGMKQGIDFDLNRIGALPEDCDCPQRQPGR